MTITLDLTETPDPGELARLGASLAAFNEGDVGPSEKRALAIFARDETGAVVAGLSGYTAWGWLYIQWLWVAEAARGQGLAAEMLGEAEAEARARTCHGIWIDTFNPVALRLYEKAGYVPFGALDAFPEGRTRTFLQKRLIA